MLDSRRLVGRWWRTNRSTCNHNTRPDGHSGRVIIVQKIESGGIRGGGRHLRKGKQGFIKHHVARDDDPVRVEIKTSITLVIGRIAKEDTKR